MMNRTEQITFQGVEVLARVEGDKERRRKKEEERKNKKGKKKTLIKLEWTLLRLRLGVLIFRVQSICLNGVMYTPQNVSVELCLLYVSNMWADIYPN